MNTPQCKPNPGTNPSAITVALDNVRREVAGIVTVYGWANSKARVAADILGKLASASPATGCTASAAGMEEAYHHLACAVVELLPKGGRYRSIVAALTTLDQLTQFEPAAGLYPAGCACATAAPHGGPAQAAPASSPCAGAASLIATEQVKP